MKAQVLIFVGIVVLGVMVMATLSGCATSGVSVRDGKDQISVGANIDLDGCKVEVNDQFDGYFLYNSENCVIELGGDYEVDYYGGK